MLTAVSHLSIYLFITPDSAWQRTAATVRGRTINRTEVLIRRGAPSPRSLPCGLIFVWCRGWRLHAHVIFPKTLSWNIDYAGFGFRRHKFKPADLKTSLTVVASTQALKNWSEVTHGSENHSWWSLCSSLWFPGLTEVNVWIKQPFIPPHGAILIYKYSWIKSMSPALKVFGDSALLFPSVAQTAVIKMKILSHVENALRNQTRRVLAGSNVRKHVDITGRWWPEGFSLQTRSAGSAAGCSL